MAKQKRKAYEGLTILQQRFCEILFSMEESNQRQAYIQAGYKSRGPCADVRASELVRNIKVRAYLNYLREQSAEKAIITKAEVLREIKKYAFANIQDYIDKGNAVKDLSTISRERAAAVESIKITPSKSGLKVELKLYSKDSGLDKLAKHLGLYEKDNAQKQDTMQVALIDMIAFVGGLE